MPFDPVMAERRFGCGLSPRVPPPPDVAAMLDGLRRPDLMAVRHPIETFDLFRVRLQEEWRVLALKRQAAGTPKADVHDLALKALNADARRGQLRWMAAHVARRVDTDSGFRERLAFFWADHFTATGKTGVLRRGVSPYMQDALRPHLAGRFEDMLIAAVTHPLMVHYLDNQRSIGPNSPTGQRRPDRHGMNENLAREVLELHTLGAGGPYTQNDVAELTELFTGLAFTPEEGRKYRKAAAEPGAEVILGQSYGGGPPRFADIEAALRDLARHPATARHIAGKLAVHFVSDRPDPGLIAAMEAAWRDTGGDLPAVCTALLEHPAAWRRAGANASQPFDFLSAACRALDVPPEALSTLSERDFRQRVTEPMRLMGHAWQRPPGPDGLPESDGAWFTPQGMAARLTWAVTVPQTLVDLPDPRAFVSVALGPDAPAEVHAAARAAESRADGVGLVLISPAFQRMG